jgi:molybdopterin-guanine dinucleotide biosynthesis protein A
LRGRPLARHALERLAPQVSEVLVSANRNLPAYRALGHPLVHDRLADGGPLAGILAAAERARTPLLFVCPGDAPLLPMDLVATLADGLRPGIEVAVPHDGARIQHLFMLVRRDSALTLAGYLDAGGRSVHGWLEARVVAEIPVSGGRGFENVNTAAELARLESDHGW